MQKKDNDNNDELTIDALAAILNRSAVKEGLFSDNKVDVLNAEKDMPDYREVLQELYDTGKLEMNDENQQRIQILKAIYVQGILSDLTGEKYIYQILAYGMEIFDFKGTNDFSGCIYKMGFTVEDFIGSIRLRRGLYTVFQRHYPDRLKQKEYMFLFADFDEDRKELMKDLIMMISVQRRVSPAKITADDLDEFMEANQEIFDLYDALGNCVELAIAFPYDNEEGKSVPAITSKDPLLGGALMLYENGTYVLCQNVNDHFNGKALNTRVARFADIEKAKDVGELMFNHPPVKEKTFVIPLSSTSYAKTVYPFKDFEICYPEGEDGELSGSQKACAFSMRIFFAMMSDESREHLRDTGKK